MNSLTEVSGPTENFNPGATRDCGRASASPLVAGPRIFSMNQPMPPGARPDEMVQEFAGIPGWRVVLSRRTSNGKCLADADKVEGRGVPERQPRSRPFFYRSEWLKKKMANSTASRIVSTSGESRRPSQRKRSSRLGHNRIVGLVTEWA